MKFLKVDSSRPRAYRINNNIADSALVFESFYTGDITSVAHSYASDPLASLRASAENAPNCHLCLKTRHLTSHCNSGPEQLCTLLICQYSVNLPDLGSRKSDLRYKTLQGPSNHQGGRVHRPRHERHSSRLQKPLDHRWKWSTGELPPTCSQNTGEVGQIGRTIR